MLDLGITKQTFCYVMCCRQFKPRDIGQENLPNRSTWKQYMMRDIRLTMTITLIIFIVVEHKKDV